MTDRLNGARILMYSHDTFGLGHLRRCRTIAHALVERFKGLSVLIISGSQIAGAFDFRARVDFVKIPSVIKLYSGDYTSVSEHIDISDTLIMRESLIRETARLFNPDIFITDKEPLGLKGEVESTLEDLRGRGCKTVLGLRDVMDSPELLEAEWEDKQVTEKISDLYDDVWIYGPRDFWNPLKGIELGEAVEKSIRYTGFLRREEPETVHIGRHHLPPDYLLVTAGGGGDGGDVMSWILAAREYDDNLQFPLVMVPGPFMKDKERTELRNRAERLAHVNVIDFDSELEAILARSRGLVGMCGYNTFCEAMSFDKPALFLPRTKPREEQLIRAQRAEELGISAVLDSDLAADPARMAEALRKLPDAPRPSDSDWPIDLNGLDVICDRVEELLFARTEEAATHPNQQPAETYVSPGLA